mgnify:CR=1 FL=1
METEKYAALLTALKLGSLRGAADAMGYTVSGISRMIASLENEVGFPLLLRGRGGVTPTEDCRLLLPAAETLVLQGERCRQLAARVRGLEIGSVTVGVCYNAYCRQLAGLIAAFSREYPGIQINVLDSQLSSDMVAALNHRRVDLCFISRREGVPRWLPLQQVEVVAVLSRSSPLAQYDAFPLHLLNTQPYIRLFPDRETDSSRALDCLGIRPNVRFTCYSVPACLSMVGAGLGIALVDSLELFSLPPGVVALPLAPRQIVEAGLGLPPQEETSPAVRRFAAYVRERFVPEGSGF